MRKHRGRQRRSASRHDRSLQTGAQPLHVSAEVSRRAIKKMKLGEGSSDGISRKLRRLWPNCSNSLGSVRPEAVPRRLPRHSGVVFSIAECAGISVSWAERGPGYVIGGFWLPAVAYADDVVLLDCSTAVLHCNSCSQSFKRPSNQFSLGRDKNSQAPWLARV